MVQHTQTIHRLLPKNFLSVFDHFVELALKELIEFMLCMHLWQENISVEVKYAWLDINFKLCLFLQMCLLQNSYQIHVFFQ